MFSFFTAIGKELVKLLPPALARLLLLSIVVAGFVLHFSARLEMEQQARRLVIVETNQSNTREALLELTEEIRNYRSDILKQNEELRKGHK
jgi:hypothetical protein